VRELCRGCRFRDTAQQHGSQKREGGTSVYFSTFLALAPHHRCSPIFAGSYPLVINIRSACVGKLCNWVDGAIP
jgi:hypothetical protein